MQEFGYTLLKIYNKHSYQRIWWGWNRAVHLDFDFHWQGIPLLQNTMMPATVIIKVWPCWLQRQFKRPQLFYLNTEVTVKQGFRVFWETVGKIENSYGLSKHRKNTGPHADTIHKQLW